MCGGIDNGYNDDDGTTLDKKSYKEGRLGSLEDEQEWYEKGNARLSYLLGRHARFESIVRKYEEQILEETRRKAIDTGKVIITSTQKQKIDLSLV
jgi:hypothetical protein